MYGAWSGFLLGVTVAVVLAFEVVVVVPLSSGVILGGSLGVTLGRGAAHVVSAYGCGA